MKAFISSVITGFEEYRDAAAAGAAAIGAKVIRSENFGGSDESSRVLCLRAAQDSDVTVVVLGDRYGETQDSGLSASHEEFREAIEHGRVRIYFRRDGNPDQRQRAFIGEALAWQSGRAAVPFSTPQELKDAVTLDLHRMDVELATGEPNPEEAHERVLATLNASVEEANRRISHPTLHVAVVGAPVREILRPSEVNQDLASALVPMALTGEHPVLDLSTGTEPRSSVGGVQLVQEHRLLELTSDGVVRFQGPAQLVDVTPGGYRGSLVLAGDHIASEIERFLRLSDQILELVDETHRIKSLAIGAAIGGAGYHGWVGTTQQAAVATSFAVGIGTPDPIVVPAAPMVVTRATFAQHVPRVTADLVALLAGKAGGR